MENKQVVAAAEMVEKIRAAIEAGVSPDFLIIARTDADVLFVEAPQSEQESGQGCDGTGRCTAVIQFRGVQ